MLYKNFFKLQKKRYFLLLSVLILASLFTLMNSCTKVEQPRYVYIIGGAHEGERINVFKKKAIYSAHPWEIFAIEANPYVIKKIPKASDTVIMNKAIWFQDGKIKFYFCPQNDSLSSVYEKNYIKKYLRAEDAVAVPILIESIDFGQWLKRNFNINDYIVVSLDIEGAEYEVLDKMIRDNTIQYIDVLLVEFHPGIAGKSENDINELLNKIKKLNVCAERVNIQN